MITLRPYQNQIIDDIRSAFSRGQKSVLLQLPTGGGKTALAAEMIRLASNKQGHIWFICNRVELIDQTSRALNLISVDHSFISNGYDYDPSASVYICSIQTLFRRLDKITNKPSLIFWDECQSINAKTWRTVYNSNPQSFHVLLTATPCRLDGQGFREFATALVQGPSVSELTKLGYLCKYRAFAPQEIDPSKLHKRMGDYVKSEISTIVDQPKFTGSAVTEYIKRAMGKRNLVFCVNIEHSKHVRDEFISHGILAEHIDGETDKQTRTNIINKFKLGEILVLTSVDLVTTGFDVPAIEVVTFLRPTASLSLAIQMMGRGLRPHDNKSDVLFLDHVNLFRTHGLPDTTREWSLDGVTKKSDKEQVESVKTCEMCFAAIRSIYKICPYCGHIFISKAKKLDISKTKTDDELAEITLNTLEKKTEQRTAETYEDLVRLAVSRGYKRPHFWAKQIHNARMAKKRGKKSY